MNIIIDFEALGGQYDSKIVSASFLSFNPNQIDTYDELKKRAKFFQFNYKHEEQSEWGYTKSTIDWWKKQPSDVQEKSLKITENSCLLIDFFDSFNKELETFDDSSFLWSRGNNYDFTCLDRILIKHGKSVDAESPFYAVFKIRDVRTFVDAVSLATGVEQNRLNGYNKNITVKTGDAHDPVHDVVRDALAIQICYSILLN